MNNPLHQLSRPNSVDVPLAPSYEHLIAYLDGAHTSEPGQVPSGSPATVLINAGITALVQVITAQGHQALGWVPSAWLRPAARFLAGLAA